MPDPKSIPHRTVWCKHFRAMSQYETCELGIRYADVRKDHDPIPYQNGGRGTVYTMTRSLPCIPTSNLGGATCDKCEIPSEEEQAAEDAELKARMENTMKARAAIVLHLDGAWKRGMSGSQGAIDCPVCGKAGGLHFARSGYNGHIHAHCETANCCSWME